LARKHATTTAGEVPTNPAPFDLSDMAPKHLAEAVFNDLSPRLREELPLKEIRAVAEKLQYADTRPARPVPALKVRRLLFRGTKTLSGHPPVPIQYDQAFAAGVNVILIEHNLVGKSSILKTIKFALTGDHDEYDRAVRDWIKEVWLQFTLDSKAFTMLLAERDGKWHAVLVPNAEERPLEDVVVELPRQDHHWVGLERIRQGLAEFFFREYSLASLGWTVMARDGELVPCTATWQTYFQALRILDDDHKYLLCEPTPGRAGQEPILFTAFLGLHLAEPLNQLGAQASTSRKVKLRSESELEQLKTKKEKLLDDRRNCKTRLKNVLQLQRERRQNVLTGEGPDRLVALEIEWISTSTEVQALQSRKADLAGQAQKERAQAKRLRTRAALQGEFTGLEVTRCPSCAKAVDTTLIERESETHECRLCSKTATSASPDDTAQTEIEAGECEVRAERYQQTHGEVVQQIDSLRAKATSLRDQADRLRVSLNAGLSAALPTAEEEEERQGISEGIGKLDHQIWLIDRELEQLGAGSGDAEKQGKIAKRLREALRNEAERRNQAINARLNDIAQKTIVALGANQITGITCTALGDIALLKNGVKIAFTGIKNPGERFRVKLALFLAMMQFGREVGFGRHPGFLLIDQLGAAEMVPDNLRASAATLRKVDVEFSKDIQIICCTARPEFREATRATKVYGHKTKGPNGEPYAF
jgi:hypothetical protein